MFAQVRGGPDDNVPASDCQLELQQKGEDALHSVHTGLNRNPRIIHVTSYVSKDLRNVSRSPGGGEKRWTDFRLQSQLAYRLAVQPRLLGSSRVC